MVYIWVNKGKIKKWFGFMVGPTRMIKNTKFDVVTDFFVTNFLPNWNELELEVRIEVKMVFKLYLNQLISSDQLIKIISEFRPDYSPQTNTLICATENPQILVQNQVPHSFWSLLDKLILVICAVKSVPNFDNVCLIFPNRTKKACFCELSRILTELHHSHKSQKEQISQKVVHTIEMSNEKSDPIIVYSNELELLPSNQENDSVSFDRQNFENIKPLKLIPRQLLSKEKERTQRKIRMHQLIYARKMRNLKTTEIVVHNNEQNFKFPSEFMNILIDANSNIGKGNGKRYTTTSKIFWVRLKLYSWKAYTMMKNYLEGPSESTIETWEKNERSVPRCEDLENIEKIDACFQFWGQRLEIDKDTSFTISLDAAKIDENLSITSDGHVDGTVVPIRLPKSPEEYRNNCEEYQQLWNKLLNDKMLITHIFILLMCPISTKKAFPIFVQFTSSGSASQNVTINLHRIVSHFVSEGVKIRFIASDADPCYRFSFNNQFSKIMNTYDNGIININNLNKDMQLFSNDAYHCLKRLRKAMVNNEALFLMPSEILTTRAVNQHSLQKIDQTLPNCIFRTGSMHSMDDYYPAALFKWSTLRKANESGNFAAVIYLWVGVLARKVMVSKHISRYERCKMCYLGLCIVIYYKLLIDSWKRDKVPTIILQKMIMSSDLCIDFANCFTCIIKALTTIKESFPLSRISSIPSEHFFGRMRRNAGNSQTASSIRSAINKINFVDAFRNNNIDEHIHKRRLETAIVEPGSINFMEHDIVKCANFINRLFQRAGLLPKYIDPLYSKMMIPLSSDIDDLMAKYLDKKEKNQRQIKNKWTINAAQYRVNGRYGRDIKNRYSTSARVQ